MNPSLCVAMKTNLVSVIRMLALVTGLVLLATLPRRSHAALPEPDNVAYGRIYFATNRVTARNTNVVVELQYPGSTNVLASYRMGANPDLGSHYAVAIHLGARRDGLPATTNGSLLNLVVREGNVERARTNFLVGGPLPSQAGYVARIDFGSNTLTGFDAWLAVYELESNSGAEDADRDGSSNRQEFLAGTNPTNAASKFVLRIAATPTSAQVSFDALRADGVGYEGLKRHYALERISDPGRSDWQSVPNLADIIAANQVVNYQSATTNGPVFFRGKVWLGDASGVESGDFRLWMSQAGGQTLVSFLAPGPDSQGRNCYYTLEHSTNLLTGSWRIVPGCSNVLGAAQTITHVVTNVGPTPGFYRARLMLTAP